MKKLIIIILTIFSLNVFAQEVNMLQKSSITISGDESVAGPHQSDYLYTYLIDICDFPFDSIDFCFYNCTRYMWWGDIEWGIFYLSPIFANNYGYDVLTEADTVRFPHGYAQIMHNDTLLAIGGVSFILDLTNKPSGFVQPTHQSTVGDTVLIMDALTMDVLYEQVLSDTIDIEPHSNVRSGFYEIIFDSAVQVQGDYLIAYKYNPANVLHQLVSSVDFFGNTYYHYLCGYSIPLTYMNEYHPSVHDTIAHESFLDNSTARDQIYYYKPETGWLPCLNYRNYFSLPQDNFYSITLIDDTRGSLLTDLFPEDRTITPHTTDLGVFAIPEYAIDRQTDTTGAFANFIPFVEPSAFTFTPNPTNDIVNVYCDYMMYFAEIYNLQGTKLDAKKINAYQTSLSLAKYPDGIYLMKINTDKGFITKRIIKQ